MADGLPDWSTNPTTFQNVLSLLGNSPSWQKLTGTPSTGAVDPNAFTASPSISVNDAYNWAKSGGALLNSDFQPSDQFETQNQGFTRPNLSGSPVSDLTYAQLADLQQRNTLLSNVTGIQNAALANSYANNLYKQRANQAVQDATLGSIAVLAKSNSPLGKAAQTQAYQSAMQAAQGAESGETAALGANTANLMTANALGIRSGMRGAA